MKLQSLRKQTGSKTKQKRSIFENLGSKLIGQTNIRIRRDIGGIIIGWAMLVWGMRLGVKKDVEQLR